MYYIIKKGQQDGLREFSRPLLLHAGPFDSIPHISHNLPWLISRSCATHIDTRFNEDTGPVSAVWALIVVASGDVASWTVRLKVLGQCTSHTEFIYVVLTCHQPCIRVPDRLLRQFDLEASVVGAASDASQQTHKSADTVSPLRSSAV